MSPGISNNILEHPYNCLVLGSLQLDTSGPGRDTVLLLLGMEVKERWLVLKRPQAG